MVDDAIVDKLAFWVQHRRVNGATRCDLFDVTGGATVNHIGGVFACDVQFFKAGHVHQAGFGADSLIVGFCALWGVVIEPRGTHAVPVFEFGADGFVAWSKNRMSPKNGHVMFLRDYEFELR